MRKEFFEYHCENRESRLELSLKKVRDVDDRELYFPEYKSGTKIFTP